MKKIILFAVAIIMMMAGAVRVEAQKSKMYSGDKSAREIKKSQQVLWSQIAVYDKNISNLRKENTKLIKRIEHIRDSNLYYDYKRNILINDSLITFYQKESKNLRAQANGFVAIAAAKDKQSYLDLRGGKPEELANAYLVASYAENIGSYKNAASSSLDPSALKGKVRNMWSRDVTAKVTGPGNFYLEFYLKPGTSSPAFPLPFIGIYTTTFVTGTESKSVTKRVGPNIVYYDYDTGEKLDYMATLPAY